MSQPTAYVISTDFSEEEASGVSGRSTVRTPALDAELSAIVLTISEIRANMAALQRDDLKLIDSAVELHTLSAEVLTMMGSAGFTLNDPIDWATATEYAARSMVKEGTGTYVCVVAHTSGVFATDLAAGKWLLIFDTSAYIASVVSMTPTGDVAATNVQAGIAELASEKSRKDANLSDLASAATARDNLSVPTRAQIQNQTYTYFADTGTADALVVTPSPVLAAYATGQRLAVKKAAAANATTAPTLDANGLGAKVIFKRGGLALAVGDMLANGHYIFEYDAAYNAAAGGWELLNPDVLAAISAAAPGSATTDAEGLVELATQAEQETGTDVARAVTPGRQQFHQSAAKGWVKCNFAGAASASYNVASITDVGTGQIQVNWSTDFSGADYCVTASPVLDPGGTTATTIAAMVRSTDLAVGTTKVDAVRISDGVSVDVTALMVVAFGDQ